MKRQGIEGFTFDSEAEEWAAWCASAWEHDVPTRWEDAMRHIDMTREYLNEAVLEPRHSPAQPQNTVGIGEGSGQGDKAPVWPLLAFSVVCIVWGAWASGWL